MPNDVVGARDQLTQVYCELYPVEVASLLDTCTASETIRELEKLTPESAAGIISNLHPDLSAVVLEKMKDEHFKHVHIHMDPLRLANLLARLPQAVVSHKQSFMSKVLSREIHELMHYPPDSVGAVMSLDVLHFHRESTVDETLSRIRSSRQKRITDIYVVDSDHHLVGAISIQDLAMASPSTLLESLIHHEPISIRSLSPKQEVIELLQKGHLSSVPVVDVDGYLVGVIRYDALLDVVQQDATADIQAMVGVSPEERALSKVSFSVKKRLPWLMINLATTFVAAFVVSMFESTIARFTALAILLPVVAGQSGNTGAQALAVISRGIALREVRLRHGMRVMTKEAFVGLINGLITGIICAGGIYLWSQSTGLAFIIGLAMVISMFAASVSGAAIPVLLTVFKQDPAQASSIILTTVTDVVGFLTFLGLATLLSHLLMGLT